MQYKDNCGMQASHDIDHMGLHMMAVDGHNVHMVGEITDRIYKNGVLIEERVGHNLIVNSFLKLAMALLKGQSGFSGIGYWAVGSGASSWDTNLPDPEINATVLTAEIGRVKIQPSEITFLDANYNPSANPTNILQIKHTFDTNDCNGIWREFGIFGGQASATANTGLMINKKHHKIITKTSDMTIERTMRFTLNLV